MAPLPPVLMVHGALGDARSWAGVQDALPPGTDARAITLSYFGTAAWTGDGSDFGTELHARDIAQYIEATMTYPVALVAWSYSAHPALLVALRRPDLVATLVVFEPAISSFIADDDLRGAFGRDAGACFGDAASVLQGDGEIAAAHRLFDNVSGTSGFIASLSGPDRRIALENARTLPFMMGKGQPPTRIAPEEIAALQVPLVAAMDANTRPAFAIPTRVLAEIAPQCRLETVSGGGHLMPIADPQGFARHLAQWLAMPDEC